MRGAKSGDNVAQYGLAGGGFRCPSFWYCPFHTIYTIGYSVLISFFNLGTMWHCMGPRAGGSAFGWVVPLPQFLTIVLLSTFHSTLKPLRMYFMPVKILQSMGSMAGGSAKLPQYLTIVLLPFSHSYNLSLCAIILIQVF